MEWVIKNGNFYLDNHVSELHWTDDINKARRFHSHTAALSLGVFWLALSLTSFDVVRVGVEDCQALSQNP